MKYIMPFVILCILFVVHSCNAPCTMSGLSVSFSGFDSADLATVMVKTYVKNGSFSNPVDSSIYSSSAFPEPYPYIADTFNLGIISNPKSYYLEITADSDYEIDIPAIGEVYKINGVSIGHQTAPNSEGGSVCSVSYSLNGKSLNDPSYPGTPTYSQGQVIVIEK